MVSTQWTDHEVFKHEDAVRRYRRNREPRNGVVKIEHIKPWAIEFLRARRSGNTTKQREAAKTLSCLFLGHTEETIRRTMKVAEAEL